MRVLVGALTEKPVAWTVSKVENANELGIQMLTLYQDFFDEHTDYVNLETGEMYADYYGSYIEPITLPESTIPIKSDVYGKITSSTSTIKIGGSYKNLTTQLYDANGNDITDTFSDETFNWSCSIEGEDISSKTDVITWLNGTQFNQKKIRFSNDRSYLDKVLNIRCTIADISIDAKFELIV